MKETTIEARILKEDKRLREIYKDLPNDVMKLYDGLIWRAAYMRVTLEDYEKDIVENGSTELFSQSEKTDPYERERPVSSIYNRLIKNYQVVIKQLSERLPAQGTGSPSEEILKFALGK